MSSFNIGALIWADMKCRGFERFLDRSCCCVSYTLHELDI